VIDAAASKWNFIKFTPGLVGGHCISVDPYYLIEKALYYGVLPRVMSAARRLNDGMGEYVANRVIKLMNKKGILVKNAHILILGVTFKENCPDIRNTRVVDIYKILKEYTPNITVFDPYANSKEIEEEYQIMITTDHLARLEHQFDAIILAVAHNEFRTINLRDFGKENCVVYDVKGVVDKNKIDGRL
jgi:UDP-N-acetyl-D-galactosamine dehydrogenase